MNTLNTLLLTLGMTVSITLDGADIGTGTVTHLAEACDSVEGLFGEDLGPSSGVAMVVSDSNIYLTVNPYTGHYEGTAGADPYTFVTPAVAG